MGDKLSFWIRVADVKRILKYCNLTLCKSQRAKWVTSFLIIYVLCTVFYVRQYVFNERDPSFKFCENTIQNHVLTDRSNYDRTVYNRLSDHPFKPQNRADDFVIAHDHIFLYSAYLDDRKPPAELRTRFYIKIVSILLHDPNQRYLIESKCHIKFSDEVVSNETAVIVPIPEDHSCCYTAAFILCPVSSSALPTHVAVTIGKSQPKWVFVQSLLERKSIPKGEIAVCIRPFYGKDFSIVQLAEFISYHHSKGVNHFQFYNVSAPIQVQTFLDLLLTSKAPLSISLLQWNIPLKRFLVHEWGQLAFIQDCILRWQTKVEFVAILDLDELLMPQTSDTLTTTLAQLQTEYPSASAFVFPSVMFCQEYLPANRTATDLVPFVSLFGHQRQATPWPHCVRSKYVVQPSRVSVAGIHFIWESLDEFGPVNIPADLVTVYHYRTCCNVNQPWLFGFMVFSVFSDAVRTDTRVIDMAAAITNCPVYRAILKLARAS